MVSTNPFIENLPPVIKDKLHRVKPPEEPVLIQVATDMADERSFGEQWLVVTGKRLLVIPSDGADGTVEVPIPDVKTVKAEELVGGGRLELERKLGGVSTLHYSRSLAPKFAEVAEGIRQLSQGEALSLPTELAQNRCSRCGSLLPEKDGVCPACVKKLDTFMRILGYMMAYKGRMALMVILTVIGTVLELIPPKITQYIIDDVLTPGTHGVLLVWFVLALLGINALSWATQVGKRWLSRWLGHRSIQEVRGELYGQFQFLPLRFYDRRRVGALISTMTNDSDRLETYMVMDMPFILSNSMKFIGILFFLFLTNWELTLLVLLPVPPIVLVGSLMWNRLMRFWRLWGGKWSRLSSQLNESITGIRVVKAFAQEEREGRRFDKHNEALRAVSVSGERTWFVFFTVSNFFMSCGVFLVWYFGGGQILREEMTLGELVAFISYLWMLYGPLQWFGDYYNFMLRAFAGAERIFEILDSSREQPDGTEALPMPRMEGRVVFRNTQFGYDPGKPVLKGIDLDVAPGEMIGLVGKSGVGKSTMINLICRFYDPDRGCVEIDGLDMRNIRLKDLRSHIGMVHQEPFLFDGTILENIAYGKSDAPFKEVVRAAMAAEAHEFIVRKPDGYDTMVGERGGRLSGGEKQRIAIARAILSDPKILILDEATSSVDTQTEKRIQEAIARLVKGRTTFAIAHRLSTLRIADKLVVMDDGKIAEVGTHEELMAREGHFHRLVKTQQETSAVVAVGGGKNEGK